MEKQISTVSSSSRCNLSDRLLSDAGEATTAVSGASSLLED
jgi:hypothetical protein